MADKKDIESIHSEMLSGVPDTYQKSQGFPVWDIIRAFAIGAKSLWDKAFDIEAAQDVRNLYGSELDRFVTQRKGIYRREATCAKGTILVTGYATVKVGDQFATDGGVIFEATAAATIDGTGEVYVQAIEAGAAGCVPAHTITKMPVTIQGITELTNAEPTTDGYDAEDDDTYRERYLTALKEPATSGNIYHYRQWATAVSGVGGARVYPLWAGDNTVKVVIIDQQKKSPSAELVERVQAYIDPDAKGTGEGEAPIGAYCTVEAAKAVKVNLSVKLSLTGEVPQSDTELAIKEAVTEYLASIAFVKDYVSYAKVGDAILDSVGVDDIESLTLNGKSDRVKVASNEVAELGEVVVNVVP